MFKYLVPTFAPEGFETGWYFAFPTRDGKGRTLGPFVTKQECARVITTAEPCYACGLPVFHSCSAVEYEAEQATRPPDGVVLCVICEPQFIADVIKHDGEPPRPMQPRLT